MGMTHRIGLAWLVGLTVPAVAQADHHDGMAMESHGDAAPAFGARLSLLAATYSTMNYIGDYQGAVPSFTWSGKGFGAGASLPLYRLQENGRVLFGLGDAVVHARATLVDQGTAHAGASLAVSAPTGNHLDGLGMGHVMAMPAAWGLWAYDRLALLGSVGYSRAIADASSHADHGPWPLVEPMNLAEVTWSAASEVAIGSGVRAGVHASGGIPFASSGHARVIGAVRVAWGTPRVDTGAELQAGLVGDPFTIRGVVETTLHF
jgi:hypothetical protein